jgi:hypothetical protein
MLGKRDQSSMLEELPVGLEAEEGVWLGYEGSELEYAGVIRKPVVK